MKKIVSVILMSVLVISTFALVNVAASDDISVVINETKLEFDVPPTIVDGRTMVPFRAIFEALGARGIEWDADTKAISAVKDGKTIRLAIGSETLTYGNIKKELEVAPFIEGGRTLIPLRAISEIFGYQVGWSENNRTIVIVSDPTNYKLLYNSNATICKAFKKTVIADQDLLGFGWQDGSFQTLYAPDGTTKSFKISEVAAQLQAGWSTEPLQILYALDGTSQVFKKSEVPAQLKSGWYAEPVQMLYAVGKSKVFKKSEVDAQLTVGWYTEPVQMLYTADGRTQVFKQSEVPAQLTVGWYTEPVQTLYATGGRTQVFKQSEVPAQLEVGWYTTAIDAYIAKFITPSEIVAELYDGYRMLIKNNSKHTFIIKSCMLDGFKHSLPSYGGNSYSIKLAPGEQISLVCYCKSAVCERRHSTYNSRGGITIYVQTNEGEKITNVYFNRYGVQLMQLKSLPLPWTF